MGIYVTYKAFLSTTKNDTTVKNSFLLHQLDFHLILISFFVGNIITSQTKLFDIQYKPMPLIPIHLFSPTELVSKSQCPSMRN